MFTKSKVFFVLLIVLFALSTPVAFAGTGPEPSFSDVPPGHGFFAYIEAIYAEEITTCFSDGTFRPNDQVTRGQIAAFLARALGLQYIVDIAAIEGVTTPVVGATPVTTITETAQYTGTVSWTPSDSAFGHATAYTAMITLTAKPGYTFEGVAADFFTVAGATSVSNAASSGMVTALFPATGEFGETTMYLAFTSDVHGSTGNLQSWLSGLRNSTIVLNHMVFGGDYTGEATALQCAGIVNDYYPGTESILVRGNHENTWTQPTGLVVKNDKPLLLHDKA